MALRDPLFAHPDPDRLICAIWRLEEKLGHRFSDPRAS